MSRILGRLLAGTVIMMLAVIGAPVAGASAPDIRPPGDRPATAAPAVVGPAAAPTTSPSVSRQYTTDPSLDCPGGFACAWVDYGSGWYLFKFYNYGAYYLSNWAGSDFATNAQTGGASMRLYNRTGGQLKCIAAGAPAQTVDWDPVWRINLSAIRC